MGASRKASNANQAMFSNQMCNCSAHSCAQQTTTCKEQERAGNSTGTSIRVSERPMVVMMATLHNISSPPIKYALLRRIFVPAAFGERKKETEKKTAQ
jgi:hypothetical protein